MAVVDADTFSSVSWQDDDAAGGAYPPQNTMADSEPEQPVNAGLAEEIRANELFGGEILECTVSHPVKENDGTKDAYVSYLITTNVGFDWPPRPFSSPCFTSADPISMAYFCRQPSRPSRSRTPRCAGDSPTLSFFGSSYLRSSLLPPCRRCRISSAWNTFGETALAPSSHAAAHTLSNDSSLE